MHGHFEDANDLDEGSQQVTALQKTSGITGSDDHDQSAHNTVNGTAMNRIPDVVINDTVRIEHLDPTSTDIDYGELLTAENAQAPGDLISRDYSIEDIPPKMMAAAVVTPYGEPSSNSTNVMQHQVKSADGQEMRSQYGTPMWKTLYPLEVTRSGAPKVETPKVFRIGVTYWDLIA